MSEEEMDSLTEITNLFNYYEDLEAVALETAHENDVCFDDLYVYTPTDIVIRSSLDYVTKSEKLLPLFLSKIHESIKPSLERFILLTKKELNHNTRKEVIALQELRNSYGKDIWQWTKDAFEDSTEYVGSDLEEYSVADIQTATLQILCNYW
jgi:hypothetical protein